MKTSTLVKDDTDKLQVIMDTDSVGYRLLQTYAEVVLLKTLSIAHT